MKIRPITFSPAMISALLRNEKFVTRRLFWLRTKDGRVKKNPWAETAAGDVLYVREACSCNRPGDGTIRFSADGAVVDASEWKFKRSAIPPMHMPKLWSRLMLKVDLVDAHPLREIDTEQAIKEGMYQQDGYWGLKLMGGHFEPMGNNPVSAFARLWDKLHKKQRWEENPTVVAINFKPHWQNVIEWENERA